MSSPQGIPKKSLFIHCPHCSRPFRTFPSHLKRRGTLFCSRPCYLQALRAFMKYYRERHDHELQEAA